MTRILALDLGLKTGYFDNEIGGTIYSPKTDRELFFYNQMLDILVLKRHGAKYDIITFEEAQFQKGVAGYIFNGQRYIINMLAQSLHIPCVGIHSMTVKKTFTGSGKAEKADMIAEAAKHTEVVDDNHADAVAVYHTYKILNGVK